MVLIGCRAPQQLVSGSRSAVQYLHSLSTAKRRKWRIEWPQWLTKSMLIAMAIRRRRIDRSNTRPNRSKMPQSFHSTMKICDRTQIIAHGNFVLDRRSHINIKRTTPTRSIWKWLATNLRCHLVDWMCMYVLDRCQPLFLTLFSTLFWLLPLIFSLRFASIYTVCFSIKIINVNCSTKSLRDHKKSNFIHTTNLLNHFQTNTKTAQLGCWLKRIEGTRSNNPKNTANTQNGFKIIINAQHDSLFPAIKANFDEIETSTTRFTLKIKPFKKWAEWH